uniref:Hpt domain-containing protein n=1 Tax=Parerythrobacter lutipelagi TaxID=1964208 RepID=UPI0010F6A43D|nr:Hpt domain-containing protein [Parerythrobacter lutipelagi]
MAFESGNLDATFAAAAGEDPALMAELRVAFGESVARQIDLLKRSRCDANWEMAAQRLKGLAASFHADALIKLSQEAVEAAPGEPTVIRRIETFYREFIGQDGRA